jgi:phenylacetate-coenzyme A ligase PaaK-like adenylate-forming protein
MTDYEDLKRRHIRDAMRLIPSYVRRLSWSREQIREEREAQLRSLVRLCQAKSPWHARRLGHIDPETLVEEDLQRIPPMTKNDLMENWDEIVTDRSLTLVDVEEHLATVQDEDKYLRDEYHACVSSGSTGRHGVFLYDWDTWTTMIVSSVRHTVRELMTDPELASAPRTIGALVADRATHVTAATNRTFDTGMFTTYRFPVSQPLAVTVAGLNDLQPTFIFAYAGVLRRLAERARSGELQIRPKRVMSTAEPLFPEVRAVLEETWGAPVTNHYAGTEGGMMAVSSARSRHMTLSDDLLIIEPVDRDGRPVPAGVRSSEIYLTNLFNHAMPLIRYRLSDEVTVVDEPCPYGSGHRLIADVKGRQEDSLLYDGGVEVHPYVFWAPLGRERSIIEYQVHQTPRGAEVFVRCQGELHRRSLCREIEELLANAGLESPVVEVREVEEIQASPGGKVQRFVRLTPPQSR